MQPGDMYHVGIVVADLEDGQAHFADLFGVRWAPTLEAPTAVRAADGSVATVDLRLAYSVDAPQLELIEAVPGSIWVLNPHSNIHHIGFWSDDVGSDSARLHGGGCPLEVMGDSGGSEPMFWAYHRDRLGVRIELVDGALRAPMQAGWDSVAEAGEDRSPTSST
jgi:Glyoxalase/Bleomycin resistance protein/Dioxygenase superfamily